MTRSERVNGWRLNPNITQALIPPIGLVLTWLDLFYSMWFLLGQMNGYGWPIYIAVKTSANLTNWDGLSLLYYHLVLLTLEHSGSSWGIWNLKKHKKHLFISTQDLLAFFQTHFAIYLSWFSYQWFYITKIRYLAKKKLRPKDFKKLQGLLGPRN